MRKILILKVIGYVMFGLWFLTAMVLKNETVGYAFLALSVLSLIASTVFYAMDYQKRKKASKS